MNELSSMRCAPCAKGAHPMNEQEVQKMLASLKSGWKADGVHHLEREFRFSNFKEALDFTIQVGNLAEAEGHHPDITLSWGKVKVAIWTHKIGGLTLNDFILASKIDLID